jgi:hypothetical protein
MNYFKYFPKFVDKEKIVTDIFNRVNVRAKYLDKDEIFYKYILRDYDTPESIAAKYYEDPSKHWIIMMVNNIFDNRFDMGLSDRQFRDYLNNKYSSELYGELLYGADYAAVTQNPDPFSNKLVIETKQLNTAIYNGTEYSEYTPVNQETYYIDNITANTIIQGDITVNDITKSTITYPITIYDWEEELNIKKKTIKLIKKEYINTVESELKRLLQA